jgi:hypothetical protein
MADRGRTAVSGVCGNGHDTWDACDCPDAAVIDMDVQALANTVREGLAPRGTPHHEMPLYMQRDQQRTNAQHAALDALVARVEAALEACMPANEAWQGMKRRAEAAEAERDRLVEALRFIQSAAGNRDAAEGCRVILRHARAALAGLDNTEPA